MKRLDCKIIEVENGYIVTETLEGYPIEIKKWVAKNPAKLAELIEGMAIEILCARTILDSKPEKDQSCSRDRGSKLSQGC